MAEFHANLASSWPHLFIYLQCYEGTDEQQCPNRNRIHEVYCHAIPPLAFFCYIFFLCFQFSSSVEGSFELCSRPFGALQSCLCWLCSRPFGALQSCLCWLCSGLCGILQSCLCWLCSGLCGILPILAGFLLTPP